MATISRKFFPLRSQYTASSKSFAVSPSMVTSGSAVRSTRSLRSAGRTSVGRRLRLAQRFLRELERQGVLAQRDLDLDARIGGAAQHFRDARDGLAVVRGLLDDLGDDDLADLRVAGAVRRDQEVLVDPPVLRDDEVRCRVPRAGGRPLRRLARVEHFDDLALGPSAAIHSAHAHDRAVSVQHLVHFARVQEVVVAAVLGNEEAEAVGMPLHDANDEIELGDDAQFALAVGEQLAVALHRGEPAGEGFARDRRDVELALELGRRHRNARGFQRVEDGFARRQQSRIDVAAARRARTSGVDDDDASAAAEVRFARVTGCVVDAACELREDVVFFDKN